RAGQVSLREAFSGLDFFGPTSTDVHVLQDGSVLFNGSVTAFGAGPSFTATRTVLAGDTIDIAVGYGSDGTFTCDTTGLDAVILYSDSAPAVTDYTFTPADAGRHTFGATFWTPGTQSLTATDTAAASLTGNQGNIEVTTASQFLVSGFPSPIITGIAGNFSVSAVDVYGNIVPGYRG